MSSDHVWHKTFKKSWWDGTVTAWCGATQVSGAYETDTFYLFKSGKECPACLKAKKKAGK